MRGFLFHQELLHISLTKTKKIVFGLIVVFHVLDRQMSECTCHDDDDRIKDNNEVEFDWKLADCFDLRSQSSTLIIISVHMPSEFCLDCKTTGTTT